METSSGSSVVDDCVQERIAKSHGSQCGFCTPGMVMSMYTLLRNKPKPSMEDITQALAGPSSDFLKSPSFSFQNQSLCEYRNNLFRNSWK